MSAGRGFEQRKRAMIRAHGHSLDFIGLLQSLTALLPLAVLWGLAVLGLDDRLALTAVATCGITLFHIRVFALMHECGHGALFASRWLNRTMGFMFGHPSGNIEPAGQ